MTALLIFQLEQHETSALWLLNPRSHQWRSCDTDQLLLHCLHACVSVCVRLIPCWDVDAPRMRLVLMSSLWWPLCGRMCSTLSQDMMAIYIKSHCGKLPITIAAMHRVRVQSSLFVYSFLSGWATVCTGLYLTVNTNGNPQFRAATCQTNLAKGICFFVSMHTCMSVLLCKCALWMVPEVCG